MGKKEKKTNIAEHSTNGVKKRTEAGAFAQEMVKNSNTSNTSIMSIGESVTSLDSKPETSPEDYLAMWNMQVLKVLGQGQYGQ